MFELVKIRSGLGVNEIVERINKLEVVEKAGN